MSYTHLARARLLASRRIGEVPTVRETLVESAQAYVKARAPKRRGKQGRKVVQAGKPDHSPKSDQVDEPASRPAAHDRWRAEQEFGPRPLPVRK